MTSQTATSQVQVTTRSSPEWEPRISSRPNLTCLGLVLALLLTLSSARAQEDIDLTGYTLVFEDNFDTLSVANTDDKDDHTWYFWPPYGPAGAFSASHWVTSTMECQNGVPSTRRNGIQTATTSSIITGRAVALAQWIRGATALHSGLATGARK